MSFGVTLCFYLVIGAGIAAALWINESDARRPGHLFRIVTAYVFWPLYVPLLLTFDGTSQEGSDALPGTTKSLSPPDEMTVAIHQVEAELDTTLNSLNGWAESALATESDRFAELRAAWHQQANRIREMDVLLKEAEAESTKPSVLASTLDALSVEIRPGNNDEAAAELSPALRLANSERARTENLAKLKLVRQQSHDDLMATLAAVRQLVSMIHLAHYTGAPASRATELVQQIAQVVERLSKPGTPLADPADRHLSG